MSKTKIGVIILMILLLGSFLFIKFLYPLKPDLSEVPNPIRDRATQNWKVKEERIPKNPLKNLYFGDMHVHTKYSFDAYLGGTRLSPSEAYDFAKGKTVTVVDQQTHIERPLDFAAITDHSEYFGELQSIIHKDAPGHFTLMARYFRGIGLDTLKQRELFNRMLANVGEGEPEQIQFFQGFETAKSTWDIHIKAAEDHYEPGKFTTFAAYEWTRNSKLAHIHRNVFFKDMVVPDYPISAIAAKDELALWKSLDVYRKNGATVMAIPHNSNLSEGGAFPLIQPNGEDIDLEYAKTRNENEPLVEIHQAKGNSEVHASLWQNDEYANFENYHQGPPQKNNMVREVLKRGLKYKEEFGVNPYEYGFIGSTDTHNGVPGNTEEDDDFVGNHVLVDLLPETRATRSWVLDGSVKVADAMNPGGLMAVWAEANTRPDIYNSMTNKETYATSGTRISLRFFASKEFESEYETYDDMVSDGYERGVAMGGEISDFTESPSFIIWAAKDPIKANLDRVQVIKGWYDGDELQEKIFDVAISENPVVDELASVDMNTGEWDRSKGQTSLFTVWKDPEFNPEFRSFYYLRVLEVPTPRWNLWDEIKYGVKYHDRFPKVIRERAWSSPIWYNPK